MTTAYRAAAVAGLLIAVVCAPLASGLIITGLAQQNPVTVWAAAIALAGTLTAMALIVTGWATAPPRSRRFT